jgi:hypothetical protein
MKKKGNTRLLGVKLYTSNHSSLGFQPCLSHYWLSQALPQRGENDPRTLGSTEIPFDFVMSFGIKEADESTEAQRGHNRVTPFSFFKIVNSTFRKVETMFQRFFYSIGWEFRVD